MEFQHTGRKDFEVKAWLVLWGLLRGDDGRNMGKTWDLWFRGELSGQAQTMIHKALLSLCNGLILKHTRSFHRRESMVLEKLGPVK